METLRPTQKAVTLTDRVDYLANALQQPVLLRSPSKNCCSLEIPCACAQWLRVMMVPSSRASTATWYGSARMPSTSVQCRMFFYCMREREDILRIFEMYSGQRMMTSYIRIGGLALAASARLAQARRHVYR